VKIYKMTATFGKLEHQTLELKPGLNVITAPNEWGKSTWCAFLTAMLYGIDTRAKSTKTALADKERYLPWSGAPMSGRIDLNWNGRDITIERNTKGRVPMGEFKAYETRTGIPVPELKADNCGAMLLGVEQSVYRRAGFIRHADLPVTQDEALRRRLNALVTTGDENNTADRLGEKLKELKNRCRYNRTGLLPQAESERDGLQTRLTEWENLDQQCKLLQSRIEDLTDWIFRLENHRQTMEYAAQQETARRLEEARSVLKAAGEELERMERICAEQPSLETARQQLQQLQAFREQWSDLQTRLQQMPLEPPEPQAPAPFTGMRPEEARKMARQDAETFVAVSKTGMPKLLILMGILGLAAAGALVYLRSYPFAAVSGLAAAASLVWGIWELISLKKKRKALLTKYGDADYGRWASPIVEYERVLRKYVVVKNHFDDKKARLEQEEKELLSVRQVLCGEEAPETLLSRWTQVRENWEACFAARREHARAESHRDALQALIRPVEKPSAPDTLTQSEKETTRLLTECTLEQQRLQNRMGQYQGRMEALGSHEVLSGQLALKIKRIRRLEEEYAALSIAQETFAKAKEELQRRFAPRITRRARTLLSEMTGGRYNFVVMGTDFSLQTRAGEEDILREAAWRSDGTMDQLYLALRLAVAEELTPEAPLVLDDVLVRFDNERTRAAVALLKQLAKSRQIILFTCQGREADM